MTVIWGILTALVDWLDLWCTIVADVTWAVRGVWVGKKVKSERNLEQNYGNLQIYMQKLLLH